MAVSDDARQILSQAEGRANQLLKELAQDRAEFQHRGPGAGIAIDAANSAVGDALAAAERLAQALQRINSRASR